MARFDLLALRSRGDRPLRERFVLFTFVLAGGISDISAGVPTANPDTYAVRSGSLLRVSGGGGVMANDIPDAAPIARATVTSGPWGGRLKFNDDGSFEYVAKAGFSGTDSFIYVLEEAPEPQTFQIDQARSSLTLRMSLDIAGLGSSSDWDRAEVAGTMTASLTPTTAPFATIHITDLNATLADALGLRLPYLFGAATVNLDAAAGGVSLSMTEAGPAASVAANGAFIQAGNTVSADGMVTTSGGGLAAGAVPTEEHPFDVTAEDVELSGLVTESAGTVTITAPVVFSDTIDLSGNPGTINVNATIVATAPTAAVPGVSEPAFVTIRVDPRQAGPATQPDHYFAAAGEPFQVSAAPTPHTDVLVPAGSEWRYLDDGSDGGTAWREPEFDDSAWNSGPARLGYGGDGEVTFVSFGNNVAAKHITTYFRRRFDVPWMAVDGTSLRVYLQRDDGAAVYLNGVEVVRDNLPPDAAFNTPATDVVGGPNEMAFVEFDIAAGALRAGGNVLAVEVHQDNQTSSDLGFDLRLERTAGLAGVLANDTSPIARSLAAALEAPPSHGSVDLNPDGSFTYTPAPGFTGEDAFRYSVSDGAASVPTDLIAIDSAWKYHDSGTSPGTGWASAAFDDSEWQSGRGELGYGDGDETTLISFGADPELKHPAAFFRGVFFVSTNGRTDDLILHLRRDDAAAVFLNGAEIYRDGNLAPAATHLDYATAGAGDENEFLQIPLPSVLVAIGRNVLAVEVHQAEPNSSDFSFAARLTQSLPAASALVSSDAVWTHLGDGSAPGAGWTGLAFDDSGWSSGPAPLGYGDGDEATVIDFGPNPAAKPITTFFRHRFPVADASSIRTLIVGLSRDDGAAVYLNGVEIVRDSLAPGAGPLETATTAADDLEKCTFFAFHADSALLVDGENVIAAEVHQASASSFDLRFALDLAASRSPAAEIATITVAGSGAGDPDSDGDGMPDAFELQHGLAAGVNDALLDLDGDGATNIDEFRAGTTPDDARSVFRILSASGGGGGTIAIVAATVPGYDYHAQSSDSLGGWSAVPGSQVTATGSTTQFLLPLASSRSYFRIAAGPAP